MDRWICTKFKLWPSSRRLGGDLHLDLDVMGPRQYRLKNASLAPSGLVLQRPSHHSIQTWKLLASLAVFHCVDNHGVVNHRLDLAIVIRIPSHPASREVYNNEYHYDVNRTTYSHSALLHAFPQVQHPMRSPSTRSSHTLRHSPTCASLYIYTSCDK